MPRSKLLHIPILITCHCSRSFALASLPLVTWLIPKSVNFGKWEPVSPLRMTLPSWMTGSLFLQLYENVSSSAYTQHTRVSPACELVLTAQFIGLAWMLLSGTSGNVVLHVALSHLACHRNPSCHLHNQNGLFRLSVWISLKRWTIATWLVQTDTVAGWLCTRSPQIPEPWNLHAVQYSALTVPLKNWAQMAEPCSLHMISRYSYMTGEWNTACPQHTIPSPMVALSLLLKLQNESWWATLDPMVTWTMTSLPEPLWSIVILPYLMVALPLPNYCFIGRSVTSCPPTPLYSNHMPSGLPLPNAVRR